MAIVGGGELAVLGGAPVRSGEAWTPWPVIAPGAESNLLAALGSRRWAISAPRNGASLFERRFALDFARYLGVRHCVPVDHGSSALVVALECLGLDFGSPVFVPALTWTASASAAFRAGLTPVLTDVDIETGCVSTDSLRGDVSPAAVVAVHWACGMADVGALRRELDGRGIPVVEDCAQSHGAQWGGAAAGTLGDLGCFSMQHSKVLTGGEGGAVVTNRDGYRQRLEELRADSRSYRRPENGSSYELDLEESATVLGCNFCMSEFSAAVLCAQLKTLDEENRTRHGNYAYLAGLLGLINGVHLVLPRKEQTASSIYEGVVLFDELNEACDAGGLAEALTCELGMHFYQVDAPLNRSVLLKPETKPTLRPLASRFKELNAGATFPNADYIARHGVQFHHAALLGRRSDMDDIATAVEKVCAAMRRGRVLLSGNFK